MTADPALPTSDLATSGHVSDRLCLAVERLRAPVCVGIDPVVERLPRGLTPVPGGEADAIERFSCLVIGAVAQFVPCIKVQSACFERYGSAGFAAMERVLAMARDAGVEIILDAKRGDIGLSADHYAKGAAGPGPRPRMDWITINSYLGEDGIRPFLPSTGSIGAFALVRTSNPGGDELQEARLADGSAVCELVAAMVARLGASSLGTRGYSGLGAVVGATKPAAASRLRALMPRQVFLVPGFGAQGGSAADALPCFHPDGHGALVTASRSVLFAFRADDPGWEKSISDAAASFAEEIGRATGWRR